MKIKLLLTGLLALLVNVMQAQHSEHHETDNKEIDVHQEEGHHGKHKVALYYGFTHIPSAFYKHETHEESTGKWAPTVGLEYYYSLNKKWELGLLGDMELDEYFINTTEQDELERNNVVVMAAVGKFKPTKRIGLFAGPGYEWEFKNHTSESFFVLKAGIEFEVEIENGWELTPIFSYDFKEEYSAYAFGISIGKRF